MSDQQLTDASSMTGGGESSEAVVEVNIKTLDSQVFSFQVDKNMLVSEFKEKIASKVGLPVEQQRLIFRGKVLKDEHTLSEYHVDNGHTLHLVARQPSESQPPSGTSHGEASSTNGQDPNASGRPTRIGQISHSVVLGTLNPADEGEVFVPDISGVIGAVLNSIGLGGQAVTNAMGAANGMRGPHPNMQFNVPVQVPLGNQMDDGTPSNTGSQNQSATQAHPGQAFSSQSFPQGFQIPMGAAVQIPMGMSTQMPSLNVPIPDSLRTLSEFMSRMELALSQNGSQPNEPQTNTGDLPALDFPSNARGLPTPEGLMTVLNHAQRLLGDQAIAALSHISGRLEQEGSSTDVTVRGQIQRDTMQLGIAMQHMGALLLELGRTILTLRMGQSPDEAYVNAGPAVYISSSGPNPIMVQPFPLQTSSLFGEPTAPLISGNLGPVGIGAAPRQVNIHIHTALGPRGVPNGDGTQGGQSNRTGSGVPAHLRVRHPRIPSTSVVPPQPSVTVPSVSETGVPVSQPPPGSDEDVSTTMVASLNSLARGIDASQTSAPVSQPPAGSDHISRMVAGITSGLRDLIPQDANQAPSDGQEAILAIQDLFSRSGASNDESNNQLGDLVDTGASEFNSSLSGNKPDSQEHKESLGCSQSNSNEISLKDSKNVPPSNLDAGCNDLQSGEAAQGSDNPERAPAVPLGLGLGGLQPKKKSRQPRMQSKASDAATSNTSDQNQQKVTNDQQLMQALALTTNQSNIPLSGQLPGADGQIDVANAMTEVLHSPAFNGLLSGVSQQTGVGSPNVLRNMFEQLTRNPAMMNTVNQIAQQFDGQDVGNMLSGMGRGQGGGGFDLAGMVQQMMPIVSQALGGGPSPLQQPLSSALPEIMPQSNVRSLNRDEKASDEDSEIDLRPVLQRIENQNPPQEIFRSLVATAARLNDVDSDDLLDELCSDEGGLPSEFMEVLRRDLRGRFESEKGTSDGS